MCFNKGQTSRPSLLHPLLPSIIFAQQLLDSVPGKSIQLQTYFFFLISNPQASSSTSVGTMASLTAFFACLYLKGFFKSTLNNSSLSVNLSNLRKSRTDQLSNELTSWVAKEQLSSLVFCARLSAFTKFKTSTLLGLQCFLTSSCRSSLRMYWKVVIASGNCPQVFSRVTLSQKFLSLVYFAPTSAITFLEDSYIFWIWYPFPYSMCTSTLSKQIFDPSAILSYDWKQACRSSSEAVRWILVESSRISGFFLKTYTKREAPLRGVPWSWP